MPKISVAEYILQAIPSSSSPDAILEQVEIRNDEDFRLLTAHLGRDDEWDAGKMRALAIAYRASVAESLGNSMEAPRVGSAGSAASAAPHLTVRDNLPGTGVETARNVLELGPMRWEEFCEKVPRCNKSFRWRHDKIARALGAVATVEEVEVMVSRPDEPRPSWYPKDSPAERGGYVYVDQGKCRVGMEPLWLAEASTCVLKLLVNRDSGECFSAHLDSGMGESLSRMHEQIESFADRLTGEADLYLFGVGVTDEPSWELNNVMSLLSHVLNPQQLSALATRTHMVSGQDDDSWSAYSSVRYDPKKDVPMDVQFALCR